MPRRKQRPLPKAGAKFTKKFKGKEYTLTVIEDNGNIKYKLGENVFNSPSGAAKSLLDNKQEVNGWVFWGMDSLS